MKTCSRCHEAKTISEFRRCAKHTDGRQAWCRDCFRVWEWEHGRERTVPVALLQKRFLESGLSSIEVARRLGWETRGATDGRRVMRTLGLRPRRTRRDNAGFQEWMLGGTAKKIAAALGLDPWEIGL